jgi:hypothetical protein
LLLRAIALQGGIHAKGMRGRQSKVHAVISLE